MESPSSINISDVNQCLTCTLCHGYIIDATTIIECLHSFCKTCIYRYLEQNKYCPICDVQVHKTKPLLNVRADKTFQALIYKLVPGLFKDEMRRQCEFYAKNPQPGLQVTIPDETEYQNRSFLPSDTNQEWISLCLKLSDRLPPFAKIGHKFIQTVCEQVEDKRYLLCPIGLTIGHLKRFLRGKFDLLARFHIDVYHSDEILKDIYTLQEIANIYTWRRVKPLKLYYIVYDKLDASLSADVVQNMLTVDDEKVLGLEQTSRINMKTNDSKNTFRLTLKRFSNNDDDEKDKTINNQTTLLKQSKMTENVLTRMPGSSDHDFERVRSLNDKRTSIKRLLNETLIKTELKEDEKEEGKNLCHQLSLSTGQNKKFEEKTSLLPVGNIELNSAFIRKEETETEEKQLRLNVEMRHDALTKVPPAKTLNSRIVNCTLSSDSEATQMNYVDSVQPCLLGGDYSSAIVVKQENEMESTNDSQQNDFSNPPVVNSVVMIMRSEVIRSQSITSKVKNQELVKKENRPMKKRITEVDQLFIDRNAMREFRNLYYYRQLRSTNQKQRKSPSYRLGTGSINKRCTVGLHVNQNIKTRRSNTYVMRRKLASDSKNKN